MYIFQISAMKWNKNFNLGLVRCLSGSGTCCQAWEPEFIPGIHMEGGDSGLWHSWKAVRTRCVELGGGGTHL